MRRATVLAWSKHGKRPVPGTAGNLRLGARTSRYHPPVRSVPGPAGPTWEGGRAFETLVEGYLRACFEFSPIHATYLGAHEYDHLLPPPSEEAVDELTRALQDIRRRVMELPASHDPSEVAERSALAGMCESGLIDAMEVRHWQNNPVGHVAAVVAAVHVPMVRDYAPAAERAEAILARLEQLPTFFEGARRTTAEVPAVFAQAALDMGPGARLLLLDSLTAWARSEAPAVMLDDAAQRAADALVEHLRWIESEQLGGMHPFAIGGEVFERKLAHQHALALTVEELVETGEALLEASRHQLETLAAEMSIADWREELDEAKADHPRSDGLLQAYGEEVERARQFTTERHLAQLPDASLEVTWTPEPFRVLMPYAAYFGPGAFDSSRTGFFWVTPAPTGLPAHEEAKLLAEHNRAAIVVTALHEGYPGHHLQLATAAGLPSMLARSGGSSLLAEGWAFYCEELAWEEGYYDQRTRIYQLKLQLWRSARIIVDAKLHTGEIGTEEAARALVDWAGLEPGAARAEVQRYTMTPTYQMSYAMGREKILELRDQFRRRQGNAFELAAFHDEFLSYGNIPVPLIAKAMTADLDRTGPTTQS